MGVKGLWSLLEQSSETVTLEQLSGKRVAVDASIWLFQFLKALRDGEGNAVAGAHVKGFFVRICKLMFYGIRPVFVFDGATPPLKRVTVRRRRERKVDASSSVQQTAEKLLQQQLRLHAIRNLDQNAESSGGQKRKASTGPSLIPEDPDVIPTTQTQPQKKPKHLSSSDAYLLPPQVHPLQTSSSTDQRLLDPNDLSHFIAQHLTSLATTVEDDSLASLSQDLQYQIILNLKVKSREASASRVAELLEAQRREGVGAFSQMQIDGLVRRNALTEKLYSVAKGEAAVTEGLGRRMAGVRGKEYVLVKDETVGAGYTMRPLAGKLSKPESDGVKIEIANEKQPKSAVDLGVYLRSAHSEPVSFREIAGDACIDISADDDQDGGSIFRTAGGIDIEVPAELLDANQPLFSDDEHEYENITTMKPSKFTSSATILDSQSDDDGELFIEIPVSPEKALHDEIIVIDDDDHVPPGDQPLFSDSDESDVFIRNSRKRAQPTKTVISSPPLSPRPRLRSLKQPPRKKPKTVPTLEEVVEEWEDLGVADSKLEPMVGDDVSVDDIMKMFADKEKKNARESSPAKTSKNAPASGKPIIPLAAATAVAAVSDELSPNEIMLLFQKNEEKSPTASTKTSGLDVLARSASGAVPDDVSPSEVMKMFAQATPTESAQTPAGEAATEELSSTTMPVPLILSKTETFVSDHTTANEVMTMFKKVDAELLGGPSKTLLTETTVTSEVPTNSPDAELIKNKTCSINILDYDSPNLLIPAWDAVLPSEVYQHYPESIELIEGSYMQEIQALAVQLDSLKRRKSKIPDTGIGHEKIRAVDYLIGIIESVLSYKETMALVEKLKDDVNDVTEELVEEGDIIDAEMAKEASENSAGRIPRCDKDLVQQNRSRSPSPTGSDASDHSLHSLQGRINRIERGQAEPESQENGDDQEAIVYFDNEEDLTDVPLAQANEDQDFLEFIAKSRQLDPVEMETEVQTNIDKLLAQKRREKRDSATISGDMIRECQDLLRLFGIPYITAPMEAESQCAWLTNAKLVDGIITDDSDVFLFGGSTVYKNMFNSNKFVQCYRQERILSHLGLEREHLILLAYLLGSDYTEGIDGVGVVSGMEIMNEFCKVETKPGMKNEDYLKGLEEFKEWVILVQRGLDRKLEASPMRKKFKSKAKNLELPQDFPDHRVFGAYILPEVNESMDAFQWGSPNIEGIRNFMEDKAGYPTKKTNEILVPVIHEMDKRLRAPVQTRLDQFFLLGNSPTKMSSKRLQEAVHTFKNASSSAISIAPRGGKSGRGSRRGGKQQVKARIKLPVAKRAPKNPIQIDSDSSSSGTD